MTMRALSYLRGLTGWSLFGTIAGYMADVFDTMAADITTGSIANNGTLTLFAANAGQLYRVTVGDVAGTNVNGEWVVLGTGQIKSVFANGCTLTFSGANVVLTNTSGGAISFVGGIQTVR